MADAAAEFLLSPEAATAVKHWSLHGQFQDFSRGVLSTAAAAYFLLIVAVMLYVSMILIGRRHWRSGWQRQHGPPLRGPRPLHVVRMWPCCWRPPA